MAPSSSKAPCPRPTSRRAWPALVRRTKAAINSIATRTASRVLGGVAGALMAGACVSGVGTIGGFDYAPQYDFSEFFAATDGRTFRVIIAGNPFPELTQDDMQRRLLPVMQANRPRPRLTFTY